MIRALGGAAFRLRWLALAVWLGIAVVASIGLPDLGSVVTHHAVPNLPDSSSVSKAEQALKRVNPSQQSSSTAVIVITAKRRLTDQDLAYFHTTLLSVWQHRSAHGVSSVVDMEIAGPALRRQFLSADGKTAIAVVGFPENSMSDDTMNGVVALRSTFVQPPPGTEVYVTGEAGIKRDTVTVSEDGVKKTEWVTILLVLAILLAVFRAPIAALVPLVAIGVSYVITARIVAVLGEHNLPVSSFTQTFLIAVLFGAGTDYCLLILSRFREELGDARGDRRLALDRTLAGVGHTVTFSGLTVLISFSTLLLAGFGIYRSAAGVSIGLAVTLLACFTLVPALLGLLGPYLFWPLHAKPGGSHADSRIWGRTARLATARPWITVGLVVLFVVPLGLLFGDKRTFDPLSEFSSNTPSIKGINAMSAGFGKGRALPMAIVLQTDQNLRTPAGLTTIERISQSLSAQSVVQEVDSATQPTGSAMTAIQLSGRNAQLTGVLNSYISPDGHVAKFTVILRGNPYAKSSIDAVPALVRAAQVALSTGPLHEGTVSAAQTTPEQWNLGTISQDDFIRTAVLVLSVVLILLAILLRSIVAPIYVISSLLGAYLVTMTVIEWIYVDLMGKPGLSWSIPFFVFFLLVALGVDYSIFLMSRFNEEFDQQPTPAVAVQVALRAMGVVIFSAAMIMAGTFGSLTASGITSLLEIGTAVIVGLLLYTVVMLGLFVPACATIAGPAHHWPFTRHPEAPSERGQQ